METYTMVWHPLSTTQSTFSSSFGEMANPDCTCIWKMSKRLYLRRGTRSSPLVWFSYIRNFIRRSLITTITTFIQFWVTNTSWTKCTNLLSTTSKILSWYTRTKAHITKCCNRSTCSGMLLKRRIMLLKWILASRNRCKWVPSIFKSNTNTTSRKWRKKEKDRWKEKQIRMGLGSTWLIMTTSLQLNERQ